jgi:PAS domain S-box-containing protein
MISSAQVYTLLLLTAMVAVLTGVLAFAVLRFLAAARSARARGSSERAETSFMAAAIQGAVQKLRDQEQQLQARAEASEHLSDQIIAGIASGLMVVDSGGTVRLVNPACLRLLRLAADAISGRPVREVLRDATPLADVVEEALRTGRPIARRTVTIPASGVQKGEQMHLGVTVSPIVSLQQNENAVICLFTDLTEVIAREEQVRLKESLARLGELTAGLAHEFRNGLATIHGYARMLEPASLPDKAATYVAGIRQETETLGAVVTNFLNFARPSQLVLGSVDLEDVVGNLVAEWRPQVERLGGCLQMSGEFPTVEGDDVLLRQALDNLFRNAMEACRSAARNPVISVAGRRVPADRQFLLTVSDNGPGIEPSVAARIFQPFFTTRSTGTGLGLALVQKIVVTHNGRVHAGNRPEGGAVFEIRLPLEPASVTAS